MAGVALLHPARKWRRSCLRLTHNRRDVHCRERHLSKVVNHCRERHLLKGGQPQDVTFTGSLNFLQVRPARAWQGVLTRLTSALLMCMAGAHLHGALLHPPAASCFLGGRPVVLHVPHFRAVVRWACGSYSVLQRRADMHCCADMQTAGAIIVMVARMAGGFVTAAPPCRTLSRTMSL